MRPEWDIYFMGLAWLVKERSEDHNTKHGAIIVDDLNRVTGIGYNSPPRKTNLPKKYFERPHKYLAMAHSEKNAILNAKGCGTKIYVTGQVCHDCLTTIAQTDIKEIVQLNRKGWALESPEQIELFELITKQSGILVRWIDPGEIAIFEKVFGPEGLKDIVPTV